METPDQRWARFPNDEDDSYGAHYYVPQDTNEERLTKDALIANRLPVAELRAAPFPPPARPGPQHTLGITDVLGAARLYPDAARDYSGSPAGFTGSLRYSMGGW